MSPEERKKREDELFAALGAVPSTNSTMSQAEIELWKGKLSDEIGAARPLQGTSQVNMTEILLKKRQAWMDFCVTLLTDKKKCGDLFKAMLDNPPKPKPECTTLECFLRPQDKKTWTDSCMKRKIKNCEELYKLLTQAPEDWKKKATQKKEKVCDKKKKCSGGEQCCKGVCKSSCKAK
jgi:hypothetical protein